MADEMDNGTINQEAADSSPASPAETSAPSQIQTSPGGVRYGHGPGEVVPSLGETIKIAVDAVPESAKDKATSDPEAEEDEPKKDEESRFDKHPRFQKILGERDALKSTIENLTNTIRDLQAAPKEQKAEELPYRDLTKMSDEEIAEWMASQPKAAIVNMYQQLKHDITHQIATEQAVGSRERGIRSTYEKFERDNPDFSDMWQAGEVQQFIETNPGHNPISAYHALTLEKRIAEVKDQTRKEAEAAVMKKIRAKGGAGSLGRGPSPESKVTGSTSTDPRLKSTKNYGGVVSVISDRLAAMRRAAGG
jgi:hypothetical protein